MVQQTTKSMVQCRPTPNVKNETNAMQTVYGGGWNIKLLGGGGGGGGVIVVFELEKIFISPSVRFFLFISHSASSKIFISIS